MLRAVTTTVPGRSIHSSALGILPKDGFKTRLLSFKWLNGTAIADIYGPLPKKLLDISVAPYRKLAATSSELWILLPPTVVGLRWAICTSQTHPSKSLFIPCFRWRQLYRVEPSSNYFRDVVHITQKFVSYWQVGRVRKISWSYNDRLLTSEFSLDNWQTGATPSRAAI